MIFDVFRNWLLGSGIKILVILAAVYLLHKIVHKFIDKAVRHAVVSDKFSSKEAEEKRENTLIKVFHGAVTVIIWVLAGLMIISELGVEIGPLIAGAGIAGLAFGFGGQYLI